MVLSSAGSISTSLQTPDVCPQITQITQIKTRTFCDVIRVNLRYLRVSYRAFRLD